MVRVNSGNHPSVRSRKRVPRWFIGLIAACIIASMIGAVGVGLRVRDRFVYTEKWDYQATIAESPSLDPNDWTGVVSTFAVSDVTIRHTPASGFVARIRGTETYLCVLLPDASAGYQVRQLLGDRVAYVGLYAPRVGGSFNASIPMPSAVDVRYMLNDVELDELKRVGISEERVRHLLGEAQRYKWEPLRRGQTVSTSVHTVKW